MPNIKQAKQGVLTPLLFLFLVSTAYGAPPFQTSTATTGSLQIAYPKTDYFITNTAFKLHFHVFNSTGGALYPNDSHSTDCYIHGYDQKNSHIIDKNLTPDSNGEDYTYQTDGSIKGILPFTVYCNNTREQGFVSGSYTVTSTGENLEQKTIWYLILGFFFLVGLFMTMINVFKQDLHAIIIYGVVAGTLCVLFAYWFLWINSLVSARILNISIFGLLIGVAIFFFMVSRSFNEERINQNGKA